MRIKTLKIENFKRLRNLEIEITAFDCLVGANNSGKTTLLQALALFDFCVHECLSRRNGQEEIEIKSRSMPPEEFYVLPVASPNNLWTDRRQQAKGKHILIAIEAIFETGQSVNVTIDLNYNRFGLRLQTSDDSQAWLRALSAFRIAYLPVFSAFLPQEERRTPAVIAGELARGRVSSVIRNLLLDLRVEGRLEQLRDILQRAFPELKDLEVSFDELNDRYIAVNYKEEGRAREFDVFSAGSGFQQFIYLFGFILLRQPTVILLDEPDVHLHGTLQRALVKEFQRLVEEGKQVLFATHSHDLIVEMDPQRTIVLDAAGARRLRVSYDIYDVLENLGSFEETQLPIAQAYRRILVVENKSDWKLLRVLMTAVLPPPTWQKIEKRLALCYAQGNPVNQDMRRLRDQLQQTLALSGQALEMFIMADRDYHPDVPALRAGLPQQHLQWHIWERNEIENYLLVLSAIERLLLGPSNRQDTRFPPLLRQAFHDAIEATRDDVFDRMVQAFADDSRKNKRGWDTSTASRKAREYLATHWSTHQLALTDAKVVLSKLKRWAQDKGLQQFSDKKLAETLQPDEMPEEIHTLARQLAEFVGVSLD